MTGRHCRHVGVKEADNGRNIIGTKFPVAAEIFSDNNYTTGIFGKWHLGGHYPFRPQDRLAWGNAPGFWIYRIER